MVSRGGAGRRIRDKVAQETLQKGWRNPFTLLGDKISAARAFEIPALMQRKERLRLAFISLPPLKFDVKTHCIVDGKSAGSVDLEACERSLVHYGNRATSQLYEWLTDSLELALGELGADVVCVNELGFPSFSQKPLRKAVKRTRELARDYNALIVAGSSHDRRTYYNSGHIFYPQCPQDGVWFHKQVSAVSTGEKISTPPVRYTICTSAFGLRIAVLLCLDLADFAAVSGVVRLADRVDVLLVPCYSEWMEKLEKIANAASRAMPGVVALVNFRRAPASKACCIVSKFGAATELKPTRRLEFGAEVNCLDLEVVPFQEEKIQVQMGLGEKEAWLFGPQSVPLRRL